MQNLQELNWITGAWQGKAFGGDVYETWSDVRGLSMTGVFKLVTEGKQASMSSC